VGASAGEETGNLNLIFRDQFTQTGIVPGSSIRGRFRADMRGNGGSQEQHWYGHEVIEGQKDGGTTEALVKFEYASLVWLPVFCPGQPVVWVTCPWLLKRYQQVVRGICAVPEDLPNPYSAPRGLGRQIEGQQTRTLFFNLGFIELEHEVDLAGWIPPGVTMDPKYMVVVDNNDMAMIHDMALYRQSRVKLLDEMKKVDTVKGAFFNVEALPEGSVMIFPVAMKKQGWMPFGAEKSHSELCFGGLESIGFGRCRVTLAMKEVSVVN
jgi:CRISPR-associated protein Cmr4